MRERVIIAGFGGQGVLFLGRMLAQAMMHQGLHVTFFPSYGAEVRGGKANCHVIISSDEIFSPIVTQADTLFALNQPSWDFFAARLRPDGLAVVNTSIVEVDEQSRPRSIARVPATELANQLGEVRVANMVMLGAYNALRELLPLDALLGHLRTILGPRKAELFDLNRRAIEKGVETVAGSAGR
jgi:2-oxoglutarate ferredoxin oxidoreductase subunit gamma